MLLSLSVQDRVGTTVVGGAVEAVMREVGVPADRAGRARAVVEDLIFDARRRTRVAAAPDTVDVEVRFHRGSIRIKVRDFRYPEVESTRGAAMSKDLLSSGAIDHFSTGYLGKDGNVAECGIRLEPAVDRPIRSEQVLAADAERVAAEVAENLVLRPTEISDLDALVTCVYRCYGYTYPSADFYQPDTLAQLINTGTLRSFVAVTSAGEVVAHAGYEFSEFLGLVPEAGFLMVDPRFRGYRLAERLAILRVEHAAAAGVEGLWSECVTNHSASQREVLRMGGVEVGLLAAIDPLEIVMAGFAGANDERMSLIPTFLPTAPATLREVRVPLVYSEAMTRCAKRLGVQRAILTELTEAEGETAIRIRADVSLRIAHLLVDQIGADAIDRIRLELAALAPLRPVAVHLDVPLADPSAAWLIDGLREVDFVWASWIPGARADGDLLRLQLVTHEQLTAASIRCASEHGQWLRDWVVTQWHERAHKRDSR